MGNQRGPFFQIYRQGRCTFLKGLRPYRGNLYVRVTRKGRYHVVIPVFFSMTRRIKNMKSHQVLMNNFLIRTRVPSQIGYHGRARRTNLQRPVTRSTSEFKFLGRPTTFPTIRTKVQCGPPSNCSTFVTFTYEVLIQKIIRILRHHNRCLSIVFVPRSFYGRPTVRFQSTISTNSMTRISGYCFFRKFAFH